MILYKFRPFSIEFPEQIKTKKGIFSNRNKIDDLLVNVLSIHCLKLIQTE